MESDYCQSNMYLTLGGQDERDGKTSHSGFIITNNHVYNCLQAASDKKKN